MSSFARKPSSWPDSACPVERSPLATIDAPAFREMIYGHYRRHGRTFPWRETSDPYRILVSEFMLQQTGVERVLEKYGPFVEAFPTLCELARASFEEVFSLWRGLGYNRRCLNLKRCSEIIQSDHGGSLPRNVDALLALPGVGRATASALLSFAWGIPTVFIETNIRTVYLHVFFPGWEKVADRDIYPLIEKTLDRADPRRFYYALMDYGVMLKKRFGGANERSSHYRAQPPFQGSDRQARGEILRVLLETPGLTHADLRGRLEPLLRDRVSGGTGGPAGDAAARFERILDDLVREGLVVSDRGGYRLRR